MKKISKILAGALVLSMALTACGPKETTESEKPNGSDATSKGKIAYIVSNLGDNSFNDSGERGMEVLRSEGWDVMKTIETGDASNADKFDDTIRDAIEQGAEYLVASSTYTDNFLRIAEEYPDQKFLVFDDSPDLTGRDNVAYILSLIHI